MYAVQNQIYVMVFSRSTRAWKWFIFLPQLTTDKKRYFRVYVSIIKCLFIFDAGNTHTHTHIYIYIIYAGLLTLRIESPSTKFEIHTIHFSLVVKWWNDGLLYTEHLNNFLFCYLKLDAFLCENFFRVFLEFVCLSFEDIYYSHYRIVLSQKFCIVLKQSC